VQNTTTGQTLSTVTLDYDAATRGAVAPGGAADQQYAFNLPDGMSSVGTIQFTVTTDVLNQIFEYNSAGTAESNNTAMISAVSGLAPAADLQVANLSLTPTTGLQSGSDVVLSWDDVNKGDAATGGSWVDSVSVTNQNTGATIFAATVPYDASATGNGPLGPGDSVAQQDAFQIPEGNAGAGPLQFTVVVDSTRSIADYTSTGAVDPLGTAAITLTSALAPYPDLAASGVTFSPASPIVGDPAQVTVGWTVTNVGTGTTSAGSWVDDVVYSSDDNPADGHVLASFPHSGDLAVNASYTQSQTFLLPPAFQGQYHLFVETNATDVVFENGSTANNDAEASSLLDVTPIPYADLIVSSVTAPSTAASGQPMTVDWSVANQGIGITNPGSWDDTLSLATDPQGQNIVANLGTFAHTGALSPGGSYSRSGDVTLPNGISGTYCVVVHTSGPYEFIYTNNNTTVSGPINVTLTPAPNLTVTNIQATPSTVPSGSTFDVTWTVENIGAGDANGSWPDDLSLQEAPGGSNRTIGLGSFTYSDNLAAGKSYTRTEKFTLPADFQGVFQVVVSTDPSGIFGRALYEGTTGIQDTTIDPNPIVVTQPPNPDLQVAKITPAAPTFQAGGTLGLSFEVINEGTVATSTPHWTDDVYLSLDDTLSEDDILLASVGNQSALQPGESYLSTVSNIPISKNKSGPY